MVPLHVKIVVGLCSGLFFVAGSRDIFFSGAALPMPDDDKTIAAVFGAQPVGSCGKKEVGCKPGQMLFLAQAWGIMVVTIALTKFVLCFSNPEGTFLRRNLFAVLGLSNLGFASLGFQHEAYFNSQGASAMGFWVAFAVEGAVLLHDAILRTRPIAKKKK